MWGCRHTEPGPAPELSEGGGSILCSVAVSLGPREHRHRRKWPGGLSCSASVSMKLATQSPYSFFQ